MTRMIVRTTTTATVGERWVIDVPDGVDIDRTSFVGAGGWQEAIDQGLVSVESTTLTQVYDERDQQVVLVREEEVPLANAG